MDREKGFTYLGLDAEFAVSEVLELSMFRVGFTDDGEPTPPEQVFHQYFRPVAERSWPGSQRVHHISPRMVAHRPPFRRFLPEVQRLVDEADCLVGFAIENDIEALKREGVTGLGGKLQLDVKDLHWLCRGRGAGVGLNSRVGLAATAAELGVEFSEKDAHGASYDTLKTMECLLALMPEFEERWLDEGERVLDRPAKLGRYLSLWEETREEWLREFARGWVSLVETADGYRLKGNRNRPAGEELCIAVNARQRALEEIDARFARRRVAGSPTLFRLTQADIEWFRAYVNEYDGEETTHRKMLELRQSAARLTKL